ncbi:MAG: transglutaminase domain-containing protein [Dehalococcoidia bacterium]
MRLKVRYETRYDYSPPVRDGITALRLRPVSRPGLNVIESSLAASPGAISASHLDGWGTAVDIVECPGTHAAIEFALDAVVETVAPEKPEKLSSFQCIRYLEETSRVRFSAIESLGWGLVESSWTAVESVLAWIPQRFVYEVGATDAATPIETVIRQGAGVCQDFAHIFLSILRCWGYHARYVSGYFFNTTPDAEAISAEAMHAWVEVYRPEFGWVGLDATTGAYADDRYVVVGYGRDYDDVRPIRGVIRGGATAQTHFARLQMVQQQQ